MNDVRRTIDEYRRLGYTVDRADLHQIVLSRKLSNGSIVEQVIKSNGQRMTRSRR